MAEVYNISSPRLIGRLAAGFVQESATGKPGDVPINQEGSLAQTLDPIGKNQEINIIKDYRWTLSHLTPEDLKEVPYLRMQEFKCTESSIKKQINSYTNIIPNALGDAAKGPLAAIGLNSVLSPSKGVLSPYEDIWPLDNPTGFSYIFPYFSKVGFELATEAWSSLDSIGDSVKKGISGAGDVFGGGLKKASNFVQKVIDLGESSVNTAMNMQYPSVGVTDRPKIFMAHNDRNINISFILYNTFDERDWPDNRDFCYLMMSQNLFNKRDYTTGVPPVFYTIYVPGQYFCRAASVTNIKVENLGNQRLLNWGGQFIVPDAYQIDITLTELVKPSKNQFEAISTGDARKRVTVRRE